MIGILPTLRPEHLARETFAPNPRYHLLSEQILAARGEDIEIVIDGVDRLDTTADTIIPEAACTSTQLHLQVEPDDFAPMWNAAQAIAGVQVAVAPTRRSCSAASSGTRPASRCSSRPPTPAARS